MMQTSPRKDAVCLEVPVYFLVGRHDANVPPDLVEDYYQKLQAPHEELIWFERSGYTPWTSETKKFADVTVKKVLVGTKP